MIDNLTFCFNKRCEIAKSNRAATSLDNVISSGINGFRLFLEMLFFNKTSEFVFSRV
jgi:hypothetical protein